MKASFVALLFVLLAAQISCHGWRSYHTMNNTNQTTTSSACVSKNKFIENLWSRDVKIFDSPRQTYQPSSCDFEWKPYKTCCDLDSLIEYAKKDREFTKQAVNYINEKFKDFYEPMNKLLSAFEKIANLPTNINAAARQKKKIFDLMKQTNLTSFKNMMANKNLTNYFVAENQKCWDHYISLRSSALCQTCSGRSQAFFNGTLGKVPAEMCTSILENCSVSFDMIVDFVEVVGVLAEQFDAIIVPISPDPEYLYFRHTSSHNIGKYGNEFNYKKKEVGDVVKSFHSEFNAAAVSANAKKEKLPIHLFEEAGYLCNRFIRLSTSPFIEDVAAHFDIDSGLFQQAASYLQASDGTSESSLFANIPVDPNWKVKNERYKQERADQSWQLKSNWNGSRRMLQLSPEFVDSPINSTFTGDVQVMAPVDNAYSSFLGAQGTSNLATNTGLTLNLTGIAP